MRRLLVIVLVLILTSCEKSILEQHYTWSNDTDTTLLLQVNPPSTGYFPTFASNVWPPMITTSLKPHSTFILDTPLTYYDIPYVLWLGDKIYVGGITKHINTIP